jgi:hypothetical protein
MLGIAIVNKKRFDALEKKIRDYQEIEQILEKQERFIQFTAQGIFENNFQENVINNMVKLQNQINETKKNSDFIKNTILELLDVLSRTEIVKKDKKLIKVFDSAMNNIKKELNILKEEDMDKFRRGEI